MKKMFNKFIVALFVFAITYTVMGAALTEERNTPRYDTDKANYTLASNVIVYVGALVAVNGNGLLVPASDTAGLNVIGRAEKTVDNSSASYEAAANVDVLRGIFRYANGGSFSNAHVGDYTYALDDQTVFTASLATNDIIAGTIVNVDSSGVWIDTRTISGQGAVSLASLTVSGASTLSGLVSAGAGEDITGNLNVSGATTTATLRATGVSTLSGAITAPAGFASAYTTNITLYTVPAGTANAITNTFSFTNGITRQVN